jgi:hypothetical protein
MDLKPLVKLRGILRGFTGECIAQSGRLLRLLDDPSGSWFVLIKGFNPIRDRASGSRISGAWRIVNEKQAFAKFNELPPLFRLRLATRLSISFDEQATTLSPPV